MTNQEPSFKEISIALAKAQGQFLVPKKTKTAGNTSKPGSKVYKYADLADVIEATRQGLSEASLAIVHLLKWSEVGFGMATRLIHSSGEFFETWYPLPDPTTIHAQDFGAILTYARRYSLSSILGVASDEDTDAADTKDIPQGSKAPPPSGSKPPIAPKSEEPSFDMPGGWYPPEENPFPPSEDPRPNADQAQHYVVVGTPPGTAVQVSGRSQGVSSSSDKGPTDAQLKRLYAICKSSNWTDVEARSFIEQRFNKTSSTQLTREEYNILCDTIQSQSFKEAIQNK